MGGSEKVKIFWKSYGFSVLFWLAALLYFSTNLYWVINHPTSTDHVYYWDFMNHFPQLYNRDTWGFYQVLYLPHFFWCYWLFYQTSLEWAYYTLSILNAASIFLLWKLLRKDANHIFQWSFLAVFFPSAISLGLWGNFEVSICTLMFFLYSRRLISKQLSLWWTFLFALLGFKIITLIWIILFRFHLLRRHFWVFIGCTGCWLILLNSYFLILNWGIWDINLLSDLIIYRSSHLQNPLLLITRISFSWPLIVIIIRYLQIYINKRKNRK